MTTPHEYAMIAVENIRAALDKWRKAVTVQESQKAESEYVDATEQDVMADVLEHIDNQQAEIERLKADAARYQWLKQAKGLTLESERGAPWTREDGSTFSPSHRLCAGGTQFGPEESLDAAIDAAKEHP